MSSFVSTQFTGEKETGSERFSDLPNVTKLVSSNGGSEHRSEGKGAFGRQGST